jgi:hypothetical protein
MPSFTVQVAIYDLSQGMARALSAQFLGGPEHAIDIIPHTGILVYGKEYFFGGGAGISVEDPNVFQTTRGIRPIEITTLESTSVTQAEFEDWCVQQVNSGLYSGMSYDLFSRNCNNFSHDAALKGLRLSQGVPQYILDVPARFLSSPMGQAMRPMLQGMQVSGGAPFVPTGQGIGDTRAAPDAQVNPWANNTTQQPSTTKPKPPITPFLDTNSRPLLSSEIKTATVCASKFDNENIKQVAAIMIQTSQTVPQDLLREACDALLSHLDQDNNSVTFGLMLLRLFVLKDTSKATHKSLEWTKSQLVYAKLTDPAKSMAWCCLSNHAATILQEIDMDLVDAALIDVMTSQRTEVKQSAASFLYNLSIGAVAVSKNKGDDDHIPDTLVSLLCGSIEAINDEKDTLTLKRRLLVVGHVIKRNKQAAQLVLDLGFDDILRGCFEASDGDIETLAQEIISMVEFGGSSQS